MLGDAFAFFFFDGVGVTSSSDCATLFGFFASGVSLGFALAFGEGVLLLDFRFLGVDFGLGMGVSSGLEDAVAACKNATVPDFSEAEICAEPSRPAIPLRVIAIVSQTCNRITGASVTEARARSSGLWFRRAIFYRPLVFATQNGVQLPAQQQQQTGQIHPSQQHDDRCQRVIGWIIAIVLRNVELKQFRHAQPAE